jgi:septal ring factor EnvC (AmiA/AmiB activator)|tara:strand:+ start:2722 stop:2997 length:276 start_codon:yes stop_codon:yes gene_type:complete
VFQNALQKSRTELKQLQDTIHTLTTKLQKLSNEIQHCSETNDENKDFNELHNLTEKRRILILFRKREDQLRKHIRMVLRNKSLVMKQLKEK